jgi:hypothetical protein
MAEVKILGISQGNIFTVQSTSQQGVATPGILESVRTATVGTVDTGILVQLRNGQQATISPGTQASRDNAKVRDTSNGITYTVRSTNQQGTATIRSWGYTATVKDTSLHGYCCKQSTRREWAGYNQTVRGNRHEDPAALQNSSQRKTSTISEIKGMLHLSRC